MSPRAAWPAASTSWSVVFPIAETTTMGCCARCVRTIETTRLIAPDDSTEEPPNFMTIISLFCDSRCATDSCKGDGQSDITDLLSKTVFRFQSVFPEY